uniref:Uncharacterized protein n=1 Tax=Tanacetum cinerariifolium TaxID=118510 RepID=A0A699W6C2_TANCI|nr:hypothetical protein [Tanacetum cinerariifolium]
MPRQLHIVMPVRAVVQSTPKVGWQQQSADRHSSFGAAGAGLPRYRDSLAGLVPTGSVQRPTFGRLIIGVIATSKQTSQEQQ